MKNIWRGSQNESVSDNQESAQLCVYLQRFANNGQILFPPNRLMFAISIHAACKNPKGYCGGKFTD